MSKTYEGGPLMIHQVGFTAATGAASAATSLPTDGAGNVARYIRVAAINESYVKLGGASVAATTNDILVQPADAVILSTNGRTHIAYIQGAAVGKVNVVPLDNV